MMDLTPTEEFVKYCCDIGAINFPPGGRKLNSQRISPYFFDFSFFRKGDQLDLAASMFRAKLKEAHFPDDVVVFGPAYKGLSIAVRTVTGSMSYASFRKEAKDHGEGGITLGQEVNGKNVVIVDDVITAGITATTTATTLRMKGAHLLGYIIAFDRQERALNSELSGVQEFEKEFKIPVYSIATLTDLISYLKKKANGSYEASIEPGSLIGKLVAYQRDFGIKRKK